MGKSYITELEDWSDKTNPELHYIPAYLVREIDGDEYTISYLPEDESFRLTLPDGTEINDYMDEVENRYVLYRLLDKNGEVLEWLREIVEKKSMEYAENNVHVSQFKVREVPYTLHANTYTNTIKLFIRRQVYSFDNQDCFLMYQELPLIADGELVKKLRSQLERFKINLPKTPYESVLLLGTSKLSPGVKQNDNDLST